MSLMPQANAWWVDWYYKSNWTYVSWYYRTDANNTVTDNYSYYGNYNPYTWDIGSNYYWDAPTSEYYWLDDYSSYDYYDYSFDNDYYDYDYDLLYSY